MAVFVYLLEIQILDFGLDLYVAVLKNECLKECKMTHGFLRGLIVRLKNLLIGNSWCFITSATPKYVS